MPHLIDQFVTDPLAAPVGRFSLNGATSVERPADVASSVGTRPWGLRRAKPAGRGRQLPPWRYDEQQQKAVDLHGRPLIDLPMGADPTADTTSTVDGEDGPSSEDWDND